ncbi:DUF202 domain-containing protein [Planctomycetes bacterium K23_9]|uniref:DUF202 domain-containing protein n=1 Tax=Stieleria marina TaxID=1930275 RepID=A0A517P0G4_9BACT|nr:hypothetical protein K239x_48740 [Planctomycetes bacterium K23_9]
MSESEPSEPKPDLALVRTALANERTLLAYGRTALMVSGTGVSLFKFFDETLMIQFAGGGLFALGLAVGLIGLLRFMRLHKRLHD